MLKINIMGDTIVNVIKINANIFLKYILDCGIIK